MNNGRCAVIPELRFHPEKLAEEAGEAAGEAGRSRRTPLVTQVGSNLYRHSICFIWLEISLGLLHQHRQKRFLP